jgi:hypothetical protein
MSSIKAGQVNHLNHLIDVEFKDTNCYDPTQFNWVFLKIVELRHVKGYIFRLYQR